MSFGKQMRLRREELHLSRAALAEELGVSPSAISNYENGVSSPKEEVLLRLFDALEIDPNYLYRDSFRSGSFVCSRAEQDLIEKCRSLSPLERETVGSLVSALCTMHTGREEASAPRRIPLYRSIEAAGYAAPVPGEDFDYIVDHGDVPPGAEFAVRIRDDSLEPVLHGGSVASITTRCMWATWASSASGATCSASSITATRSAFRTSSLWGGTAAARTSSAALRAESALSASDM